TILRVMNMLKEPRITFAMAAQEASVSVTTAERIFDTHAGISSMPLPEILCMDEVYAVLLKTSAAGYRNFDRFRKRVLYSLNKNSSIKF
ncbi:MAG: hypothetical protein UEP31_09170, partial [Anaerovoracaceae bacterium]|nr:hypothetical protein [Anaerovoracaceae bacterium]